MTEILEALRARLGEARVQTNVPMWQHTTFKIGGPADVFVQPSNAEELTFVLEQTRRKNINCFVLGNGSNLLVKDGGIRGVVVSLKGLCSLELLEEDKIMAGAGVLMSDLSKFARDNSLTGLEFAEGIPGSVGGGIMMNAGAYDGEIGDVLLSAAVIDRECKPLEINLADMAFSYRKSRVQSEGWVVASAVFKLGKGDVAAISAKMADLCERRTSKQPLELPSAGSTFKRPVGKFAGKLIMDAGLRGYSLGGAQVSEKHCGFVVNKAGATAAHVLGLMEHVQTTVHEKFGIWLEPEVKIVGE